MIGIMGRIWLDISGEGTSPIEVDLVGAEQVIGRSVDADVQLQGPNISRQHARVFRDAMGQWMIRDLESRNGTFLNGQRVAERSLIVGDVFRIGGYRLQVKSDTPTDSPATPTMTSAELTVNDGGFESIQRLDEFASPKIDATHHALLSEYGEAVRRVEEPGERMRQLCELVVHPSFHGRQALALRLDRANPSGALQPLCDPQVSSDRWRDDAPHVSRTLLKAVLETNAPLMASNAPSNLGAVDLSVSINIDEMAAIACPIRESDKHVDVLYVSFPALYGTGEWLLLVSLAAKAYQQAELSAQAQSQALARAAMEFELRKAHDVQMSLVPQLENGVKPTLLHGFDVGILFRPCKWVGGDYVDVLPLNDGRLLVVLADVSGKGMAAALVTTMLHTMVHTQARQEGSLVDKVEAMNEHLVQHLQPETFVTASFAVIDPKSGDIECVNAGHPSGYVVNREGGFRVMEMETNMPLGIEHMAFEAGGGSMAAGELYCVFSDGLSEMQPDGGPWFGIEPVAKEIAEHYAMVPDLPLATLIEKLRARFNQIEPEDEAGDDRSLLIVRRGE